MLIYNLVKPKQPQREERAKKQKPYRILQLTCSFEDHEMIPQGYVAEMLVTTHRDNKLVEPTKATVSAKIDVRLRILKLFVMLVGV